MKITCRHLFVAAAFMISSSFAWAQIETGPPREKVAVVYGQNIRYYETGRGPAVILLHGLGAVKEVWLDNLPALSAKHHVYALDQIGFGHSDKPLLDYKIATFVDFLHGFMQSQKLSKATLVGNSLGGWVATEFAARYPEMVDKLVLVDAAGLWGRPPAIDMNPSSIAETRALFQYLFYKKELVTDEFVVRIFTDHLRNNDGYTIQRTLAGLGPNQFEDAKLASIKAPTLVIWGREDQVISVASGEKFRDGIPNAKLVVIEECGHVPEIEKPEDFDRTLIGFLGK